MGQQGIETAKAISEFGILVIIAAVAIVGVISIAVYLGKILTKFLTNLISEFKETNKNMADQNLTMKSALEIIKNQTSDIDHKSDKILNKITEVCTRVEGCSKNKN